MRSRYKANKARGFSLFEMIIVIAVVGILAAAAIPSYLDVKDEAKESIILNTWQSLVATNYAAYGEALLEGKDGGRQSLNGLALWNGNIVMKENNLRHAFETNLRVMDLHFFQLPVEQDETIQHGLYVLHEEDYQAYQSSGVLPECFVVAIQRQQESGKPVIDANTESC
ncbi:type II secretion system protein [Vibrio brasiliensis]|uniref:type IV pilin protein n=1 Tax=Vibrio brasiliensis TaxID=170652 RepID=UPI0030B8E682